MRDSSVTRSISGRFNGSESLLFTDLYNALEISKSEARDQVMRLENYDIGGFQEVDSDFGTDYAVFLNGTKGEWESLWFDIAMFCDKAGIPIENFTDKLDFSALD